jgi:RND family efflux transporter MFP subunit
MGTRLPMLLAIALAVALPPALLAAEPATAGHVVAYRDMPDRIAAEGTVEAVRQSTVAAQVAGQIIELKVKVGDRVKAGQVLLRIDPRSAEQALSGSRSQVVEAQAMLANAQRSYQRSQQLYAQKFISKAALDQAELDYRATEARVAALQANAGQASTARTFTTITAPYAGVVAALPVEVGDMATPGRALLTVFDPAAMRVTATLPQSAVAAIKLQMPAQVEFPALKRLVATRQITLIPLADSRTHSSRLRLELGEVDGLLPGQFARAYFATGVSRKLVIPEAAVLRRSEVSAVYVLAADGRPQLRQVRLGETAGDGWVEVLAGLREGERIAQQPVLAGLASSTVQKK